MEKPVSLILEESKNTILEAINGCGLHPSLLEPIVRGIYLEIAELKKQIETKEAREYYDSLKDDAEEDGIATKVN